MLLRGPAITPGYWNNPEATAKSYEDGWLCTGDIVYFDDDGDFYVVDRSKDMYISGGENVYPAAAINVTNVDCLIIGNSCMGLKTTFSRLPALCYRNMTD